MGSIWTYKYGENTIEVKNVSATQLYVNGQLQDEKNGLSLKADLTGKLPTGELVKANLGGVFEVKCSLFIDNVLQEPIEIK